MKNMKTNTVQLIIAGIVVVLVAICGTFAWFAVSDSARVNQIGATVVSPSIESGVSEIQYKVNGDWNAYNGEVPLSLIPGQKIEFRVRFYAGSTQSVTLKMTNIATSVDGEVYEFTDKNSVSGVLPVLCEQLKFEVNSSGETSLKDKLYFDGSNDNKPAAIVKDTAVVDSSKIEGDQYVYYYDLILPGGVEVGNKYQNKVIYFDLELLFEN